MHNLPVDPGGPLPSFLFPSGIFVPYSSRPEPGYFLDPRTLWHSGLCDHLVCLQGPTEHPCCMALLLGITKHLSPLHREIVGKELDFRLKDVFKTHLFLVI